jgi:uncharacterized membrane protein YkoI
MNKRLWIALGAGLIVSGALGFAAREYLDDRHDHDHHHDTEYTPSTAAGATLALEDALRIATTQVPGEVVKVERERKHGVDTIEIKVLATNGRVRELTLDARDGRVIEIEDD